MGRRLLVGALALVLVAAGCGAGEDRAATPRSTAGSTGASPTGTGVPATGSTPTAASPPAATASPTSATPGPPGSSARLIAFVMVPTAGTAAAAEVSEPDQIDRLAGGPSGATEPARVAVGRNRGAGNRMFAFVLSGCRNTGASLAIGSGRITATLTGGEGISCFAAEWFLAVFAVPADQVPPGSRVG